MSTDANKKFFPHFLWLLRDVALDVTNKRGDLISPTEFLHTRVLASKSGQLTDLGRSLCSLFPSLECHTIPTPAIKPKLIRNIVELQDQLNPAFNTAVDELIQQILQQVAPKNAIDGASVVDGPALAALACAYVDAINIPGALPDLEQGWMAVIKLKVKEYSDQLVSEYEKEMETSLRGNLPMEESNLTRLHQQTLNRKRESLQQETRRLDPLSIICGDSESVLSRLEQAIVQRSAEGNVVGGVLFQFTTQNYSTSKQQCEEVFRELVKSSRVQEKCQKAVKNSDPLNIGIEIEKIDEDYHRKAVGPAAREVLEKGHRELNQLEDMLNRIPGPPENVKYIGWGPDRIKLAWDPPLTNPEAAESYVVWKREKGKTWERVRETKKTKMLITRLKSDTEYEFHIVATNDLIRSAEKEQHGSTVTSMAENLGRMCPIFFGGIVAEICFGASNKVVVAAGVATLPINLLLAPVTLPVCVYLASEKRFTGDITPESDD